MLTAALRDRQLCQQQQLADEAKQFGRRSSEGATSEVEMQIKVGFARAEQLINQDALTYAFLIPSAFC